MKIFFSVLLLLFLPACPYYDPPNISPQPDAAVGPLNCGIYSDCIPITWECLHNCDLQFPIAESNSLLWIPEQGAVEFHLYSDSHHYYGWLNPLSSACWKMFFAGQQVPSAFVCETTENTVKGVVTYRNTILRRETTWRFIAPL